MYDCSQIIGRLILRYRLKSVSAFQDPSCPGADRRVDHAAINQRSSRFQHALGPRDLVIGWTKAERGWLQLSGMNE